MRSGFPFFAATAAAADATSHSIFLLHPQPERK